MFGPCRPEMGPIIRPIKAGGRIIPSKFQIEFAKGVSPSPRRRILGVGDGLRPHAGKFLAHAVQIKAEALTVASCGDGHPPA